MALTAHSNLFVNFIVKLLLIAAIITGGAVLLISNKENTTYFKEKQRRVADLIEINGALQKINYNYTYYLNNASAEQLDTLKELLKKIGEKKNLLLSYKHDNEIYKTEISAIEEGINREITFYSEQINQFVQEPNKVVPVNNGVTDNKLGETQSLLLQLIKVEQEELKARVLQNDKFWGNLGYIVIGASSLILIMNVFLYFSSKKSLRKQEFHEKEMHNARLAAQSANDAKSEYLAMISHEIRTPMNGVLGMSNLLLQGSLTSEQQDYAKTIHGSAESLLRIVNDILDFSKIEAGRIQLDQVSVNIRELISEAFAVLPKSNLYLNISFNVDKNVPAFIHCDPVRLRQILLNFLSNAIKFTEQGSISFECKVIGKEDNGDLRLGFVIKDTGIGMAEERIKFLFKPFVQVDYSSTRKYGGTGLGLFIAYNLIAMMKGKIKVKSELGQGSTFTFYILTSESNESFKNRPVVREKEVVQKPLDNTLFTDYPQSSDNFRAEPPIKVEPPIKEKETLTELDNKLLTNYQKSSENVENQPVVNEREKLPKELDDKLSAHYPFKVLVVDDNEINLMLISKTLSKLGYECKKGSNGQMAVDMVKEEHFDLIFMDMQMPIMDGTVATTEIRKHYRIYEYPVVIALTANALGDGRDKCLEAGMQDFIAKPFKPAEIEEVIKKWAPKIVSYREKHQSISLS